MEKLKPERTSKRQRPTNSRKEKLENARLILEIILAAILIITAVISLIY